MGGSYHSVFKGRGMSFDQVRPYQPGDEIRLIDWNVSARTGDIYIKEFVEERELTVLIAVDISGSMDTGSGNLTNREVAAELAATVALSAIHNGDRVGLLLFADEVLKFVPPKKTRGHGLRVIREVLASEVPESSGTDLKGALAHLGLLLKRRSVIFLVSDFLDVRDTEREVRALVQRHDLIPLHIRDPMDLEPQALGTLNTRDPEAPDRLDLPLAFRSFRAAYREAVHSQIADVERLFRRARTDVIPIHLGESPIGPMLKYFRLRARRH
jgi:uncharacterized protein (DUF58 family)